MMEVEIWSDIACPFCFIGKKNFEAALAQFKNRDQVKVSWRSFELDPNSPKSQKIKIHEILAKKYGQTVDWALKMNQNLAAKGKEMGLDFQFEKIIPSNSFDAHRLLHLAAQHEKQNQVNELLFLAYFMEGKDIADPSVLESIGVTAGLEKEDIQDCLESNLFSDDVRSEEEEAQSFGIAAVPAFVFNRQYLVTGAQPPEVFLKALNDLNET